MFSILPRAGALAYWLVILAAIMVAFNSLDRVTW